MIAETTRFRGVAAAVAAAHEEAVELVVALTAGAAYRVRRRVVLLVEIGPREAGHFV